MVRDAIVGVLNQAGKKVAAGVQVADQHADAFYPLVIAIKRNDLRAPVTEVGFAGGGQ